MFKGISNKIVVVGMLLIVATLSVASVSAQDSTILLPVINAGNVIEDTLVNREDESLDISARQDSPIPMIGEQTALQLSEGATVASASMRLTCSDTLRITPWTYQIFALPECLKDFDGGTIRLIMQHQKSSIDEVRIIDLHIGTEYPKSGSLLSGWTRQSGGGNYKWVLGDQDKHVLADPWGWVWVADHYWWGVRGRILDGENILILSEHDIETRVIFKD